MIAATNSKVPISASRARSFAWTFLARSFENQLNATRAQTRARSPLPASATSSTSRLMDAVKLATAPEGGELDPGSATSGD